MARTRWALAILANAMKCCLVISSVSTAAPVCEATAHIDDPVGFYVAFLTGATGCDAIAPVGARDHRTGSLRVFAHQPEREAVFVPQAAGLEVGQVVPDVGDLDGAGGRVAHGPDDEFVVGFILPAGKQEQVIHDPR